MAKTKTFAELRRKNRGNLSKLAGYKQGDGWKAHVKKKYHAFKNPI